MFKVIWDKESNGVRLTMAPPAGEALNVCPRPVFWEELDFYHLYDMVGVIHIATTPCCGLVIEDIIIKVKSF